MSYEDKALAPRPPEIAAAWDSAVSVAPDPSLPLEKQLQWYKVATHVLMLNCSERTRRAAAAEADKSLSGRQ